MFHLRHSFKFVLVRKYIPTNISLVNTALLMMKKKYLKNVFIFS